MSASSVSPQPPYPGLNAETNQPEAVCTLRWWVPPLVYFALAALFLWRSTFTSDVFLPGEMLAHIAPWKALAHSAPLPPWNPLRWDGIAQFYPWRLFASRTIHEGMLPLWNPFQFCGTPFAANSQSAPFYPGNALFYLIPTAKAFGCSAMLHLALCGWFTYLFLRRLRCSECAALLGGVVFAYSAWQVAWLQLPTFLATSCWIPLIMRQAHAAIRGTTRATTAISVATLGLCVGMLLLAGHLQIAFYGLLACALWAISLLIDQCRRAGAAAALRGLAVCAASLGVGIALSAPQLLPSLELSKISHRVGVPTSEGYGLYVGYAVPVAGLVQMGLPDFFGGDTDPGNPYWGFYLHQAADSVGPVRHNAAETALYVGVIPVLLGLAAIITGVKPGKVNHTTLFFALLAILALVMALGTRIDALFYFGVPGFSQSGSPGRVLVIWSFAWSVLAALGLDKMLRVVSKRDLFSVAVIYVLMIAIGLSAASNSLALNLVGFKELGVPTLGEAFARIAEDWGRLAVFSLCGGALFLPVVHRALAASFRFRRANQYGGHTLAVSLAAIVLVGVDLFIAGIRVNPVAPPEDIYPETPGIKYLKNNVGHDRILPVNMYWSLYRAPHAVLPPNAATVYGLRDVQGYDSLLTGAYKAWADGFSLPDPLPGRNNRRDSSPWEVANMIFFEDPNLPMVARTSAKYALTPAAQENWNPPPGSTPHSQKLETGDDGMDLFQIADAAPRAQLVTEGGTVAGEATWTLDAATRVQLTTNSNVAAILNLNDQIYPGWRATVDGARVPVERQIGAPIYRSVHVPAGRHSVEFKFEPASFRIGLYLSLLACSGVVGLITAGAMESRARRRTTV